MKVITAPLPGLVARVLVKPGDNVKSGEVVVVLNVMKTEVSVQATDEGVVNEVLVKEWDEVDLGTPLVSLH
jgi:acetyl-CoA carboxylase biotin carboxyl carrier protein